MNMYSIFAMIVLLLVLGFMFDLAPAIKLFFDKLVASVPVMNASRSSNPALYNLALLLVWLITVVAILKLFLGKRGRDD